MKQIKRLKRYHCFHFASGADFSNQCEGVFVSFYLTAAGLVQSIERMTVVQKVEGSI